MVLKNNKIDRIMEMAEEVAKNSPDPHTQVGACIIGKRGCVISSGYNRFPIGCKNFPWEKKGDFLDMKYAYVLHAEANAILNSHRNLKDCSICVTLFPCNECAKSIIESGIKHVYYKDDKYADRPETIASKRLLDAAGVTYTQV